MEQSKFHLILIRKMRIKEKYRNAGFPSNFVNETICNFKKRNRRKYYTWMTFWRKKIFTLRLPYSFANENLSKLFVNKTEDYTNGKVKLVIIWNIRKIQYLFNYKDKVQHHSCAIYHGVCFCGADYIRT